MRFSDPANPQQLWAVALFAKRAAGTKKAAAGGAAQEAATATAAIATDMQERRPPGPSMHTGPFALFVSFCLRHPLKSAIPVPEKKRFHPRGISLQ